MPELNLDSSIVDERYVVERCLSHGSYAEIFLARDLEHNEETVIIKALNAFLQGTPDEDLERTLVENFQNEALALDKVRHPNIIRRLAHGTASDLKETPFHYLVLEYLAGGDMSSFCRSSALDLDHSIFYFGQVCAALAYAHSQQVIHRDIKPQNLLLSEDHQLIKVADFGVAKISPDDTSEVTRVGTNVYAPPEHHPEYQSNELPEPLTPSADIYSLAKTIYTSMSGRAPSRYAHRPIADLPEPLGMKPWADRLLSVLQKATAERVADRYQSVEAFWSDFAALRAWAVATTSGLAHPEADPDATVVRRKAATSAAGPLMLNAGFSRPPAEAPAPNFQPHVSGVLKGNDRPNRARIVIELPEKPSVAEGPGDATALTTQTPASVAAPVPNNGAWRGTPVFWAKPQVASVPSPEPVETASRSRRVIQALAIMVIITCLCLLVAATYRYFADRGLSVPGSGTGSQMLFHEGVIGGASNVNIRSDPNGEALTSLPSGTKVRVLETRAGWLRVKILEWPGTAPTDAPDSGWVDRRFVRFDL